MTFLERAVAAGAVLLVGACEVKSQHEQRYTGLTVPNGACGTTSSATLTIARNRFAFAPSDGTLIITGTIGENSLLQGDLATTGADHKPFVMHLSAKLDGEAVSGTYTTPRCTFTVALAQVHPPLL